MAVGAGPAQLLKFARGDLIRLSFEEGLSEQVAVLIDDWLLRVGRALCRLAGIHGYRELEWDSCTELEFGARFGVRQGVGWVRHLSGSSSFLDQVPLPKSELEARFPLSENLWLTAGGECRVTACDTTTMIRTSDPWAGLDDFHRAMLDFISGVEEHESRSGWAEFRRGIEHENALVESVTSDLAAAATETAISPVDPGGDALVTACRTVGQSLGIEVRATRTGTSQGSNSIERPAGRSGAGVRLSRAAGDAWSSDWWRRRGSEPLLGRLADAGDEPVALVPEKPGALWGDVGYRMFDRQGRSLPVDRRGGGAARSPGLDGLPDIAGRAAAEARPAAIQLEAAGTLRELWMVFLTALFAAVLGLSIPIAAGILVDQVIPEADRPGLGDVRFPGRAGIFGRGVQGDPGALVLRIEGRVSATMIPAVWDRLLRLPTGFFARFSSGDLAFRAMEFSKVFKKISGATVTTLVMGLFAVLQPGSAFLL